MKYGTIPIEQAGNLTESHEVISTTFRAEADTGLTGDDGRPIYEERQWLVLKNSVWTQAQEDEIAALGGEVLADAGAFLEWKNQNL
jgi:hypothetical protein